MSLINCEIYLSLTWSSTCLITNSRSLGTFTITNTKHVLVVTLSTQDNVKLLRQMKLKFKWTTNRNKHQSKVSIQDQNPYLDYLGDPSFQRVNRLFVLSFENNKDITKHTRYFLPKVDIKDYNVMIDSWNFYE